ncbi:TPA: hypothetical protein ENS27_12135 [bacterium]|nr:hypothetical protein [bacterium]
MSDEDRKTLVEGTNALAPNTLLKLGVPEEDIQSLLDIREATAIKTDCGYGRVRHTVFSAQSLAAAYHACDGDIETVVSLAYLAEERASDSGYPSSLTRILNQLVHEYMKKGDRVLDGEEDLFNHLPFEDEI